MDRPGIVRTQPMKRSRLVDMYGELTFIHIRNRQRFRAHRGHVQSRPGMKRKRQRTGRKNPEIGQSPYEQAIRILPVAPLSLLRFIFPSSVESGGVCAQNRSTNDTHTTRHRIQQKETDVGHNLSFFRSLRSLARRFLLLFGFGRWSCRMVSVG